MPNTLPKTGFLRLPAVLALIPVSKSSWWAGMKAGPFPQPVKIGPRTTCWRAEDIRKFIEHAPRRMGARFPNPRLVKIHRSYTVEEVARLFGCHKNTIRRWIRQGLEPIDDQRPIVFTGVGGQFQLLSGKA